MATAPSPNDLTRQQLDELDALLQRMLSVPLAPADTPLPGALNRPDAPPLPPSWRADPPVAVAAPSMPHLLLVEPPAPAFEVPKPEPAKPTAEVPKPPKSSAVPPKPSVSEAPKPTPAKPQAPPADPAKPKSPAAITPVPTAPPVPLPLLPLVAVNAGFDAVCGLFGPPGKLLRSAFFRHIYGLTGLGLLAYTAAHVAQTQGWITLPVEVPWPSRTWPR